jgi:nicotinate-nucleotide adenylyltransferase
MRRGFPLAFAGMKVGLFGGSFDPAHDGHAHVAETAQKRLGLDRVWWLVTPQNPLKAQSAPLAARIASAKRFARGPRMLVTDIESRLACRYTYETLRALKRLYPGVAFIFVTGADALAKFHKWRHWRELARSVPFAVVSRPGARLRAPLPRGWIYLPARHHPQSSTRLRSAKLARADQG